VSGPERVWKREKCAISILWRDRGCVIREGSHPGPVELKQTLDLDLTYRIVSYRIVSLPILCEGPPIPKNVAFWNWAFKCVSL
jgi:hypothetical protein